MGGGDRGFARGEPRLDYLAPIAGVGLERRCRQQLDRRFQRLELLL
jgi:hypothetical protein